MRTDPTVGLPAGTFHAMGTVVSVRAGARPGDDADAAAALAAVAAVFHRWEAHCSLFDRTSELSRISRGELALHEAGDDVRDAYALAIEWRTRTDGAFTPHRGDGVVDLDGVVKALAIAEAGEALAHDGVPGWAIDAGGDVLVSPTAPGEEWPVGIVDPADRAALLGGVRLGARRRAVATSGSAERGDHIWTRPGEGPTPFLQVSVAADDIVTADVLATAIVAGGPAGLDACADRFDIDVLAVHRDGSLLATPGWPRAVSDREPAAAPAAPPAAGAAR
jgi:thiamine biosynthesis lipoprotein